MTSLEDVIRVEPDPVSETKESALNFDTLDGTKKKPRKTKTATTAGDNPLPKKARTRRSSGRRPAPKPKAPPVKGPGMLKRAMSSLGMGAAAGGGAAASAGGGFMKTMAGNIPLALAFTLIPMIVDRLTRGSEEDQIRSSMLTQKKIQDELEGGGEMGDMGGDMSGMAGLMEDEPRMGDLLAEQSELSSARNLGYAGNNLDEKMYRGSNFGNSSQLAGLIGGDTARLAQLQSERTLSPAEIMSIINSDRG